MQNEYYYLSCLESKMDDFINEEYADSNFGYLPDNIQKRMAEAAYAVLKNNHELNQYLEREGIIK